MLRLARPLRTVFVLALVLAAALPAVGRAAPAGEAERLVEEARLVIEAFRENPDFEGLRSYLRRARGVLIVPQLLKAGFIVGGAGGSGVLLGRDPKTGEWSGPVFVTVASASVGLQAGASAAEVVFVIMNERALRAVLAKRFKLGADASVAVGPIGAGGEIGTTAGLGADIYAYSRNRGLFGGGALEGSLILPKDEWNAAYYGRPVSAGDVVLRHRAQSPSASGLQEALTRF